MVRAALPALLAFAAIVAASPNAVLERLVKRQSGDALAQAQGLLDLAQSVLTDISTGNATQECQQWATQLSGCQSDNSDDQVQIAICACNSNALAAMNSCASAYGTQGQSDADGFNTFCSTTLPSITASGGSSALSTAGPSATSAIASFSSALASASSEASSPASSGSSAAASPSSTGGSSGASQIVGAGGFVGLLVAGLAMLA
ncbi:hypothetical protein JCM10213_007969 [Rhodosporidiobolus nylandii]